MRPLAALLLVALAACTPADEDTSDTSDTGTDTSDTGVDTYEPPADDGNLSFEAWSGGLQRFTRYPEDATWVVSADTDHPAHGATAAVVTLATSGSTRLLLADARFPAVGGHTYTFHAWVDDDAPAVATRLVLQGHEPDGTLQHTETAGETSTDAPGWREYTLAFTNPAGDAAATLSPRMSFAESALPEGGASVRIDGWAITQPVAFDPGDGDADDAFLVAGTPGASMDVTAALDGDATLYAATNAADQGSDHVLLVWVGGPHDTDVIPLPWSKAGNMAAPIDGGLALALVQEESNGYCEWRAWSDDSGSWAAPVGTTACSGSDADGPRLEGTIDLVAALGGASPTDVPLDLAFAVAPFGTLDGDAMLTDFQVPAGNADANVDADEAVPWRRSALLAGRITPLDL